MNYEQLKKKQDELDEEMAICPKCGKKDNWGFFREYGDCGDCVIEDFKKQEEKNKGQFR